MLGPAFAPFIEVRRATGTWTGHGGTSSWTDTSNWLALRGSSAGSDLNFPGGALRLNKSNNFSSGTIFGHITFGGPNYSISGNSLELTNGIVVSCASGNVFVGLPVTLQDDQTFELTQPGANLFLTQPLNLNRKTLAIDGAGTVIVQNTITTPFSLPIRTGVVKQGDGTFWVLGDAVYSTPTVVNGGTLLFDVSLSNSVATINSRGTLTGVGRANAVTVNSGGTLMFGGSSAGLLTLVGNATINSRATFQVRINGTTAASSHNQLRVNGNVTLGGTLQIIPGYSAAVDDHFTIIQNQGTNYVSGAFEGANSQSWIISPSSHRTKRGPTGRAFQLQWSPNFCLGLTGSSACARAARQWS